VWFRQRPRHEEHQRQPALRQHLFRCRRLRQYQRVDTRPAMLPPPPRRSGPRVFERPQNAVREGSHYCSESGLYLPYFRRYATFPIQGRNCYYTLQRTPLGLWRPLLGCIPQYRSDLPLRNQAQFDIVDELVDSATAAGARELLGGNPDREAPGFFYPPTLVADIDPGNPLVVEEQFDPALPIVMYSTVDEAIQLANGLETGLGSSVWGTDRDATIRVAARLEAGTTWTNG